MSKFKKFMKALGESAMKENAKQSYKKGVKNQAKAVKKNHVPEKCPSCGDSKQWSLAGQPKKGFSVGKAAVGGVLLGPVGVAGGALGKKKKAYVCGNCGFQHVYDK